MASRFRLAQRLQQAAASWPAAARPAAGWIDKLPVRSELFGAERMEQHAQSLAAAQRVAERPPAAALLRKRLVENAAVLLDAYRAGLEELAHGRVLVPAAEWLLDNYPLVESQIREVEAGLPPGYYRQLPKLAEGPFAGYPRIFEIAWAFVAHLDSHFDQDLLCRFIAAYQRVQPLTIGELWALSITLRIVLIENLRRLADQITAGRDARSEADALATRLLASPDAHATLGTDAFLLSAEPLSEHLAAQLAKRLRDQDPNTTPALGWLERRLRLQGTSIDEVVQHAQQRQGASNVSVRNIITSLRLIAAVDWPDLFERVSLVDATLRAGSTFAAMDFSTRNLYRSAIEQLARGSHASELEIAGHVLDATRAAADSGTERTRDPGYHLIAEGRPGIERTIAFRPAYRLRIVRLTVRFGIGGYVSAIVLATAALLLLALYLVSQTSLSVGWIAVLAAIGFLPATDLAIALVNRAVTWNFGATRLPGLDLLAGVPTSMRTLVVVPTLLTSAADVTEQVDRLEVHHLSGTGGDLAYALLSDWVDAAHETLESDAPLLALATNAIARLNARHSPAPGGPRFLLLHRRRLFNASEAKWMGWERKRGKLHELNRLLRGATDTSFMPVEGAPPSVPPAVRYVITLDADTRLPRDTAMRLIGKMAHPLNQPRFAETAPGEPGRPTGERVVGGHAILQPRVTPSLPTAHENSLYRAASSDPGGMDPYAAAVSDVYQDLFGEGSFTGKGIYDVDAFERALNGRIPENALLSHDLFEGIFARAGLASDIEVVEDSPSRYDVAAKRQHRWTRGDWQLFSWAFGARTGPFAMPGVGRWKLLDNLRRSLVAPLTVNSIVACCLTPLHSAALGALMVLAAVAIPGWLAPLLAVLPVRQGVKLKDHFAALGADLRRATLNSALTVTFLPDRAWRMGDAIVRTLARVYITQRHLLEWTTAAQSAAARPLDRAGFYREMGPATLLAVAMLASAVAWSPASLPVALPFALLWLAAPAIAYAVSRPPAPRKIVSSADAHALRRTARLTWRYFETFVTPLDNMLPPDNFQEDPNPVVAHRTSPTNIGLYLLSAVAARDFGWAGTIASVERLEAAVAAMRQLPRHRGHFLNWYETRDLRVLEPAYVSAVDSGNLAGHLVVLANACNDWMAHPIAATARAGMLDTLALARDAIGPATGDKPGFRIAALLDEVDALLAGAQTLETTIPALKRLTQKAAQAALEATPPTVDEPLPDLVFWTAALGKAVAEHAADRLQPNAALSGRLAALATAARTMALDMDFAFLVDPKRKLLSIGYNVATETLDENCYDLLASEARLASLFAIAKGDVPTRHWFRLGRAATPAGQGWALVSWSGSMFEYLMPALVMDEPPGSQLEQTNRHVVQRQRSYAQGLGIPWGISESAYNARDLEFTYQYSTFGVPGLGLKRGLSLNQVIAPYATGLGAMFEPQAACRNFARLARLGAKGRFGFYEALDFTRSRLPAGENVAIVRNFMVHHQGMTIVAIANVLQHGVMRTRFHKEPIIKATELLLQERIPRNVAIADTDAAEIAAWATRAGAGLPATRRLDVKATGAPAVHLLSNGGYAVMLTAAGAGYSRWRDIAVTRWREDPTRDNWGSFVFLRDVHAGAAWSVGLQPAGMKVGGGDGDANEVLFGEDHAEFIRRDGTLTTTLDVLVSSEADGEVRRVSLFNGGRHPRVIELTSYSELVLAPAAADIAHPAFAKMFIETEHLPEFDALIATRRPRSSSETPVWAAHFAVVEGHVVADPQFETDRARFIGRGRTLRTAAAIIDFEPLSMTTGTVLDPVFSVRQRVSVPPGGVARIAFWTIVAPTRAELLDHIDTHRDRSAFDRVTTLSWTQAQVQLRHLGVDGQEAADFQRLAGPILYADPRFRAPSAAILRGAGSQTGLWRLSISGDLPIVLLRIDDIDDIAQVRQLLRAHEYWRMKRLAVDLVIVNDRASSYMQDLQIAIETAVRSSQSRPNPGPQSTPQSTSGQEKAQGAVHALRLDLIAEPAMALLLAVARVSLVARRGFIADQLAALPKPTQPISPADARPLQWPTVEPLPQLPQLEFFNGTGGFDRNGREYVTVLTPGRATPAPWINVIANPAFGFQVSAEGAGYTWAENSRENQLSPWSNDPVCDPAGEALYLRDEASGEVWTPTAQPIRAGGTYIARHGQGYTRFEHTAHGIELGLLQYVPLGDPIKISRLTIRNLSPTPRRLSVTGYVEWVLGTSRAVTASFITSEIDASKTLLARNPWNSAFPGRVAFADMAGRQTSWTADRTEFLGRHGSPAAPAALAGMRPLSRTVGAGLDPCAAMQTRINLAAGESVEIVWFVGQCATAEAAQSLIAKYRAADLDSVLHEVIAHWDALLGTVQVKTPDRAMDIMLNGWLLYQTLACRVWARSAFYQASGAYGFRDQLQDGMALTFARPETTRGHILRAAGRQFVEGDVQHWWLPHSGQGVRTRISDDRVWLAYATATYIGCSQDAAILDEIVPFLDGPELRPDEHDSFFQPGSTDQSATLFEHCARGLDQCLALTGANGLPLIGTGDWNDGMNRVGEGGKGESVWLGWLLIRTIALFAPFADSRNDAQHGARATRWRTHAEAVRASIEQVAWDGAWYRRATFDDGAWLGSSSSDECRIDSIAQSWSVLSGAADPVRAAAAMASVDQMLVRRDDDIALLFTPPFDNTPHDPGYIKGYPPGLRENGGQYSHAAMWAIMAWAALGKAEKAVELFALVNPINHASSPEATARYKVEPYVVAADVYSVAPHAGRGGWTWYTGSAGWMYRAGIEAILGIRREGPWLVVAPCIPKHWPGFSATIRLGASHCQIDVTNGGKSQALLDGVEIPFAESARVPLDGAPHTLQLHLELPLQQQSDAQSQSDAPTP